MAVYQEAFFIPEDIATGVLTGKYKIFGGVVRHAIGPNKGQIVKHLKPIDVKEADAAKGVLAKGVEIVKANPKAALLVGAGVAAAGVGTFVYKKVKSREPAVLKAFRGALDEYIDAIRNGALNINIINDMEKALQELREHKDYMKFSVQLSAEDIEILVGKIQDYTVKLATDNDVDISEFESEEADDAIINLEKYLHVQRKVFEEAA